MAKTKSFDIQIILMSGRREIEKITAGLAMALSCASSGAKVVVFLTMEAAAYANPDEGKTIVINGFDSIQKYFDLLFEQDVRIEACTSCVANFCLTDRNRKTGRKKIRKGMIYVGLSTAAIRAIHTPTLIF